MSAEPELEPTGTHRDTNQQCLPSESGLAFKASLGLVEVVDASDVLVFVLDARDPMGTRCVQLERLLT